MDSRLQRLLNASASSLHSPTASRNLTNSLQFCLPLSGRFSTLFSFLLALRVMLAEPEPGRETPSPSHPTSHPSSPPSTHNTYKPQYPPCILSGCSLGLGPHDWLWPHPHTRPRSWGDVRFPFPAGAEEMKELAELLERWRRSFGRPIVATTYRHCAVRAAVISVQEAGIGVGYREIAGLLPMYRWPVETPQKHPPPPAHMYPGTCLGSAIKGMTL